MDRDMWRIISKERCRAHLGTRIEVDMERERERGYMELWIAIGASVCVHAQVDRLHTL